MIKREPLGRRDLVEDDLVGIVHPVRGVHRETPTAARTQVEFVERVAEALGSPPMGKVFQLGPGPEDELPRGVEHACGDDLTVQEVMVVRVQFGAFRFLLGRFGRREALDFISAR